MTRRFDRFIILSNMRSGSNLLERHLNQYEGITCHGELFNPAFIGRAGQTKLCGVTLHQRNASGARLLQAIDRAAPHSVNGFRYFPSHNEDILPQALADPRCAKIFLQRDELESYVSLCIAKYTDIWLISAESNRVPVAVPVNIDDFQKYCTKRRAFFDKVMADIAAAGQRVILVDYADLNTLEKINALALELGATHPLAALRQSIKRQNPGPLYKKISNYAEIHAQLDLPAPPADDHPLTYPVADEIHWLWPRHYYVCAQKPLAFAPLLANPKQPLVTWMRAVDNAAPRTALKHHMLMDWSARHETPLIFTLVSHPLDRAYRVFMDKIFSTAPDAFRKIRNILAHQYQMYLPDNADAFDRHLYTPDDHRTAFKQFLVFLTANLQGQTDIRQDGNWRAQSDLLANFQQLLAPTRIIKETEMAADIAAVEHTLGVSPIWANMQRHPHRLPVYPLDAIYDAQTEQFARAAYAQDYAAFAFGNWQPGQAAFDLSLPASTS